MKILIMFLSIPYSAFCVATRSGYSLFALSLLLSIIVARAWPFSPGSQDAMIDALLYGGSIIAFRESMRRRKSPK